jgi:hypothetical protein
MELLLAMREDMKADHKEMMARMNTGNKEMMAWLKDLKINGEETMVRQEKTEVRLEEEEPTSVDMKPEVAHEKVPLENATRMPVGEPRKRRRDRNLDARCGRKQKERTQNKDGCWKSLVVAHRGTARRATMAQEDHFKEILDAEKLWTSKGSNRSRKKRLPAVQDTGARDKTRTTSNEKPGKDERSRMDAGKARNGTTT